MKKIKSDLNLTEQAEAFVYPVKLTNIQNIKAASQLADIRKKRHVNMTANDVLTMELLQLRFQIEDYLAMDIYDDSKRFGFFLNGYINLINKKNNEFAEEIGIHETLLSQLINNHRVPSKNIIVRLELHSHSLLPALLWYKLVEKEKEKFIKTNNQLRIQANKYVKMKLEISV